MEQTGGNSHNGTTAPPRLDELVLRTHAFVTSTLAQTVREPVDAAGRFTLVLAVALTFLVGAAGLLLAGVVLLLAVALPLPAALGLGGLLALGAGAGAWQARR